MDGCLVFLRIQISFVLVATGFGFDFGFLGIGLFDDAKISSGGRLFKNSSVNRPMFPVKTQLFGVKTIFKSVENQLLSNITYPLLCFP